MILDEPTVFLDRGHIQQLLKLIDMMRNIGVGQIIVVSHDDTLIDSADHVFQVEKDPLTNMSSITRI
jgi:exonuclease SbcC